MFQGLWKIPVEEIDLFILFQGLWKIPVEEIDLFILFQGLWKIPIEEIDRSGSFASHLAKPLLLLFDVLRDKKDSATLLSIHQQLAKTPDLGKSVLPPCL